MAKALATQSRRRPLQARSKATVQAILEATAYLLVRNGYERTSTNRIAQKAGVNIASLYQYFPSKDALVAALIDQHLLEIKQLQAAELMASAGRPLIEVLVRMATAYFGMHTTNPRLHRMIIEQVPRVGRLNPVVAFRREMTEQLGALFANRREELGIKNPEVAAFIIVHLVDSLKQNCLLERPEYMSDPAFLQELRDLLQRYLERQPAK